MSSKKDLGQFFTTNSEYILSGFESTVKDKTVLDPFAGGGDLLKWAEKNGAKNISGLDIDPKLMRDGISTNDSLEVIPYAEFNITNPPYLAKNKMSPKQKEKHPMNGYEDLYLLSMKKILESGTPEGIVIIPVNFFSAENSDALRVEFLTHYTISKVNYFKEQVFADTTYNVVAFHYTKKLVPNKSQEIEITSYPAKTTKSYILEERYKYRIAGKEINKITSTKPIKIVRLTEKMIRKHKKADRTIDAFFNDKNTNRQYNVKRRFKTQIGQNIILLNCIDTNNNENAWIKAEDIRTLGKECLVGKNTSRNIAYVILPENVSIENQVKIIKLFNSKLNLLRHKYNSLFLTNFRDNDRKRVSFDFCYKLISYCYNQL
jgi:hypothetical protein